MDHLGAWLIFAAALAILAWLPTCTVIRDLLQRRIDRMVAAALAADTEWAAIEAVLFPSGPADWYGDRFAHDLAVIRGLPETRKR